MMSTPRGSPEKATQQCVAYERRQPGIYAIRKKKNMNQLGKKDDPMFGGLFQPFRSQQNKDINKTIIQFRDFANFMQER